MSAEPTSASPAASTRRTGRSRSIRRSIIGIVVIPAVPLLAITLVGAGWLVGTGLYVRAVADSVQQVSIPALSGLASLERERSLSLAALSGAASDPRALAAQRQRTDRGLDAMRRAAGPALAHAPAAIANRMRVLTGQLGRLPSVRAEVDAGAVPGADVATYYDDVLDAAARLFDAQARAAGLDATSVQGALAATDLFRVSDLMSRAAGTASTALASGRMSPAAARQFSRLVDVYHERLTTLTPNLLPAVRAEVTRLLHGHTWAQLTDAEDTLVAAGSWHHAPAGAPTVAQWTRLISAVSGRLVAATRAQGGQVSATALADANRKLWLTAGVSAGVLLLVAAALWWAYRRSGVLVHGTLIPRISALGDEADRLVVRLVDMIGRLRAGDQVDMASERLQLAPAAAEGDRGQGGDEIAKVAAVINQAVATAADVAVKEAEGRLGARQAVLGIARRHQRPLQETLRHLTRWEHSEQDPKLLERWFTLHHLANQIRSLTDGLTILAGGRPGRQYRRDQSLLEVLRLAQSDASQYPRIKVDDPPEAMVAGSAISHVVPMVAQLLNNALRYSDPASLVTVRSMRVAAGVAIEIEDRGAGMAPDELDTANRLLREAPDFRVADLGAGTQLGLWVVAHLAHRMDITVELRRSPYGGVTAIVLLPQTLLDPTPQRTRDQTVEAPAARAAPRPAPSPAPAPRPAAPAPPPAPLRAVREPGASLGGLPPAAPVNGRHSYPPGGRTTMPASPPSGPPAPIPPAERPRLPERHRGQHLAPQLRTGDQPGAAQQASPTSPEATRRKLSALQRGSRAGRQPDPSTSTDRNETRT